MGGKRPRSLSQRRKRPGYATKIKNCGADLMDEHRAGPVVPREWPPAPWQRGRPPTAPFLRWLLVRQAHVECAFGHHDPSLLHRAGPSPVASSVALQVSFTRVAVMLVMVMVPPSAPVEPSQPCGFEIPPLERMDLVGWKRLMVYVPGCVSRSDPE